MAEQRPYRIPGFSADARLARAKRLAVLSLVGAFIAINSVTTQHAASVLRHASWLGQPLFHLRGGASIRAVVVDCLVDPMVLGSATGAALESSAPARRSTQWRS